MILPASLVLNRLLNHHFGGDFVVTLASARKPEQAGGEPPRQDTSRNASGAPGALP